MTMFVSNYVFKCVWLFMTIYVPLVCSSPRTITFEFIHYVYKMITIKHRYDTLFNVSVSIMRQMCLKIDNHNIQ